MSESASLYAGPQSEPVRSLLIEMLACVRHTQDTPLYFGIDGHRIARAALTRVAAGLGAGDSALASTPRVMARIEDLIRRALEMPTCSADDGEAELEAATLQCQLGEWMLHTHARMRVIHPLALDILGLLVEGESAREVAEQLDFGLRLTKRLVADIRAAW